MMIGLIRWTLFCSDLASFQTQRFYFYLPADRESNPCRVSVVFLTFWSLQSVSVKSGEMELGVEFVYL